MEMVSTITSLITNVVNFAGGLLLLVGLSLGADDPWRPLEPLARPAGISAAAPVETAAVVLDQTALDRAVAEQRQPLPGYTHIQRAVVSSAGMWWAGWAEALGACSAIAASA